MPQNVFERLDHAFLFEERGTVDIKGKGVMRTWYLIGRRPEPRLSDSDLAAPEHPNVQAPAG